MRYWYEGVRHRPRNLGPAVKKSSGKTKYYEKGKTLT